VLAVVSLVLSVRKVREIEKRLAEMEATFEKQVGEA
jgi:hypothetical protein